MTWNIYLNTLIPEIFQYLEDRRHLLQCALVCKTWEKYAIPQLYSKIRLTGSKWSVESVQNISDYCRGGYVQYVKITCDNNLCLWNTIFSTCSNIKRIEYQFPNNDEFWKSMLGFSHRLSKLEEIHSVRHTSVNQCYYECVLKFKKTLRYLKIFDFGADTVYINTFLTQLCEFEKLHTLEWEPARRASIDNFNRLVDACPDINSMTVHLCNIYTIDKYIPARSVLPYKSLRILKLSNFKNGSVLRYVFHKFVSLEYLQIKFYNDFDIKGEIQKDPLIFECLANLPDFKVILKSSFGFLSSLCERDLGFPFEFQRNFNLELSYGTMNIMDEFYSGWPVILELFRKKSSVIYSTVYFARIECIWFQISQYLRTLTIAKFSNQDINGNDFDRIFRNCPVINTLKIFCKDELRLGVSSEPYAALEVLTLRAPKVHHDTYVRCAKRFVNLKSLSVYTEFKSVFSLNMSVTKLDTLYLQLSTKSKNTFINIRTAVGKNYSKSHGKPLIDICCHSIRSLVLNINGVSLDIILK